MISAEGLSAELKNIGKQTLTPDIVGGLQKASQEFNVLNMEMVGRSAPALSDVSKLLSKGAPDLGSITTSLEIDLAGPLAAALPNLNGIAGNLKSSLPRVGEEVNNGLKGISSVLNDFPKEVESPIPTSLKAATTIATNLQTAMPGLQKPLSELADGLPIAAEKLKPELESAASTASKAIAGSAVKSNFNNIALSLPTPTAIAEVTGAIGKATQNVVPGAKPVTSLDIKATLTTQMDGIKGDLGGIAGVLGGVGSLSSTLSGALSKLDLPDLSLPDIGGVLGDALSGSIEGLTAGLNSKIGGLVPSITGSPILDTLHKANNTLGVMKGTLGISANIPNIDGILGNVVNEFTNGTALGALDILKNTPNLGLDITANLGDFESKIGSLQNQFGSASKMLPNDLPPGVESTSVQEQVTALAKTQSVVNNAEEVHAEQITSLKQPKAMEIGWTETYKNEIVNKDTIQPKGYYHYIVLPNGITQRDKAIGDDELIRVAVVAGYNVDKGEEGILTDRSVTYSQTLAVKMLMTQTIRALPGIKIYGKGEFVTEGERGSGSIDPGMDIDKIRKSIDGASSSPAAQAAAEPKQSDLGYPIGSRVVYLGGTENFQKTRSRPKLIQPRLMNILNNIAEDNNVWLTIHSGGNSMSKAECVRKGGIRKGDYWYINDKVVRVGSVRHDEGQGVDFSIYSDPERKQALNPSVSKNPPRQITGLIRSALGYGITGVGTGPRYMEGLIHLDYYYADRSHWAKKGENAPAWLTEIMRG